MTSKVTVVLSVTPTTFPIDTPQAGVTRVELLDAATGSTLFSQDSGYEFTGVNDGNLVMRASRLDINGNLIGAAYTQAFTAPTPTTVSIDIPTGATITVIPE